VGKVCVSDTQTMNQYISSLLGRRLTTNDSTTGCIFEELVVGIRVPRRLPTIFYATPYEWFEVCVKDLSV
jgi:hypothetical protein